MQFNKLGQPVIQLTQNHLNRAAEIVEAMAETSKELKHKSGKYDLPNEMVYAESIKGVLGELAVAEYFNYDLFYLGYDPKRSDVLGYQVRTTYWPDGNLLTHPVKTLTNPGGDNPGRYILVTIDQLTQQATLRGYSTLARCNERKTNWNTKNRWPCFFMPQSQLWPIDMLPATDELLAFRQVKAVA
jgi:hypothetical protein